MGWPFTENGVPFIICGGDPVTHRRAIATAIPGRALLGPATFVEWRPELKPGEQLLWHSASASWLIWPAGKKPLRGTRRVQ